MISLKLQTKISTKHQSGRVSSVAVALDPEVMGLSLSAGGWVELVISLGKVRTGIATSTAPKGTN